MPVKELKTRVKKIEKRVKPCRRIFVMLEGDDFATCDGKRIPLSEVPKCGETIKVGPPPEGDDVIIKVRYTDRLTREEIFK